MKTLEIVVDEGGPNERVLLDIPQWDFNWQGQYVLQDAIAVNVEAPLTVRCTYDNTPENRARVGLPPESVVVPAGEGTGTEMCIGAMLVVTQDPTP